MSDEQGKGRIKARIAYHLERRANARALRAERRGRGKEDFTDAARKAESLGGNEGRLLYEVTPAAWLQLGHPSAARSQLSIDGFHKAGRADRRAQHLRQRPGAFPG